jgi:hypothetical protein
MNLKDNNKIIFLNIAKAESKILIKLLMKGPGIGHFLS